MEMLNIIFCKWLTILFVFVVCTFDSQISCFICGFHERVYVTKNIKMFFFLTTIQITAAGFVNVNLNDFIVISFVNLFLKYNTIDLEVISEKC